MPARIRSLHDLAASGSAMDLVFRALRLATLLPCPVDAICAAKIEQISYREGLLRVRTPSGTIGNVVLGHAAAAAVRSAIGYRDRGPLVCDEYAEPLQIDDDAEEYVKELLAEMTGAREPADWSFAGVQAAVMDHHLAHEEYEVAVAQAGLSTDAFCDDPRHHRQRALAERWSLDLGLTPPPAFARPFHCSDPMRLRADPRTGRLS